MTRPTYESPLLILTRAYLLMLLGIFTGSFIGSTLAVYSYTNYTIALYDPAVLNFSLKKSIGISIIVTCSTIFSVMIYQDINSHWQAEAALPPAKQTAKTSHAHADDTAEDDDPPLSESDAQCQPLLGKQPDYHSYP